MKRALPWLAFALAALALAGWYARLWPTPGAFAAALDRHDVFGEDFLVHYWPTAHDLFATRAPEAGYYYTACFAILLTPFGALPLAPALAAWTALQVALVAAYALAVRALLRLPPAASLAFALLLAVSHPVLHNFSWGQVSVLVVVCALGAALALRRGASVAAALLLALATAIKLYPALFAALFVFRRDRRALAAFVAATLALAVALPAALLGPAPWWAFEQAANAGITRAQWAVGNPNSQYVAHVGLRWVSLFLHADGGRPLGRALTVLGFAAALGCVALAWRLSRIESAERRALPLAALCVALAFVVRTSWPHYFAWLPFAQGALLAWCFAPAHECAAPPAARRALALLPAASIALSSVFARLCLPDWNAYANYGAPFVSQLPLLAALAAIAWTERGTRAAGAAR